VEERREEGVKEGGRDRGIEGERERERGREGRVERGKGEGEERGTYRNEFEWK
jgi:hypothetical protein